MSGNGDTAKPGRGRWVLILGGSRSGKSSLAEKLAREKGGKDVLFLATGQALDGEMKERIQRHRADRAAYGWQTLEAPGQVGLRLAETLTGHEKVVLLDCLTLLISNVACLLPEDVPSAEAEAKATAEIDALLAVLRNRPVDLIVVSNEVGLGLVPPYKLGRVFRDALGRVNQRMAAAADVVVLMVAGLPMTLKGSLE
jgi:adenosylcobinamide kinase/adenosylcobinamide-phosphate guanylyltransferase